MFSESACPAATSRTIIFGALIVIFSMGIRQGFGLYLQPLTGALSIGREAFGLPIDDKALIDQ